jgi:hypothetical protein
MARVRHRRMSKVRVGLKHPRGKRGGNPALIAALAPTLLPMAMRGIASVIKRFRRRRRRRRR